MKIPKKALSESQLTSCKTGSVINDGSHQTTKVTFIYENGQLVEGYYKKIDAHYPALLAKISVATSLLKRVFQGERSAEERLVFDAEKNLVGTVSISLNNFKSFNFAEEPIPFDSSVKEQAIPTTKTLIETNMMELLLGRWYLNDDDAHPHNQSLVGDIDFDMFFYWFTIWMKNPRMLVGVPNTRINLTVCDWERFPNVQDSKPFHWPTYKTPGQETLQMYLPIFSETILSSTLPKRYPAPDQFINLASDTTAQEQKFVAALKVLLTFQPNMLKNRLNALFGKLTLDYTALGSDLSEKYEKAFPSLCDARTDKMPFVDFMMKMYQDHYDNLYRVVVFYMGCKDNGYGLSLSPTYELLYCKPSYYTTIKNWAITQNKTLFSSEDPGLQYDLPKLEKRYHQIWRDSFTPILKALWLSSYELTNEVFKLSTCNKVLKNDKEEKESTDNDVTSALQLFGSMPELQQEKIEALLSIDPESQIRLALSSLIEFTNQFRAAINAYYGKTLESLEEVDSEDFSLTLNTITMKYSNVIYKALAQKTTQAMEFRRISDALKKLMDQVNFAIHKVSYDEHINEGSSYASKESQWSILDERLINKFNTCLFDWAKRLPPLKFQDQIIQIIDTEYKPYLKVLSARCRADPVKKFLNASKKEAGDNRLAYILSSGSTDDGELNRLLIKHLTPLVLQGHNFQCIQDAIRDKTFESHLTNYTKSAVHCAKNSQNFLHRYNSEGVSLFFKTLFSWVDSRPSKAFMGILNSALNEYTKNLWFSTSRKPEVLQYCSQFPNQQAKVVAKIFSAGDDTSTLNDILFHKIIKAIVTDVGEYLDECKNNKAAFNAKYGSYGYSLIVKYDKTEHKEFYNSALKANALAQDLNQTQEQMLFSTAI